MLRILLYTEGALQEIRELLSAHSVEKTGKKEELILKAISGSYDLIILDNSIDLIPAVTAADPRAEIFVLADNCVDAIEPLKMGATACFTCPIDGDRFQKALESVIAQVNLMNETDALERLLVEKYTYAGIVARNPQMLELFRFLRKIAPYYRAVTIAGETGTGKEAIARALHALSPLGRQPFIACNCGGLVENLVESEFFGHVKGAFTGANSDKTGVFEAAGEGVVFLDEIGDLPLSFQPHLLRVLQNANSGSWAAPSRLRHPARSYLRPTRIFRRRCARAGSGRIFTSGSRRFPSMCLPCGTGKTTYPCSPGSYSTNFRIIPARR